jgi:hypothetical protein
VVSDLTWTRERRRLSELIPWSRNPRQIREADAARLAESLDQFGQIHAIAIGPDNAILDGHQRSNVWAACDRYGPEYEVDVRVASRPLEDAEREKLVVYLHSGATGSWDWDSLSSWDTPTLKGWGLDAEQLRGWNDDAANLALMLEAEEEADNVDVGVSVFSDEQIIDAAFSYFRARGFPYRDLPLHVCMQEVNKLATTEPDKLLNTNTAYHVADTYHPHRFHASAAGMRAQSESFEDDVLLRKALMLELEYGTIGLSAINNLKFVNGTQPCSNFRPGFAAYLYRKYADIGATVLDTSTGYGGRLVGFMASGVAGEYIGIDPNVPTHEGNTRMAQDLGFADKVELYNLPAEDVSHSAIEGRCDFAFTSPPYFSKEHYSDDETQSWVRYKTGEDWRAGFLVPMMELQYAALKPGSVAIVNIADVKIRSKTYPLRQWAIEAGKAAGFEYVRTDSFKLTRRFGAGMTDEVATEPVIVFRKTNTTPELMG